MPSKVNKMMRLMSQGARKIGLRMYLIEI